MNAPQCILTPTMERLNAAKVDAPTIPNAVAAVAEARSLARRVNAALRSGTFNHARLAQHKRRLERIRRDRYGFVELPYFLADYRLCIEADCASAARYRGGKP